MFRRMTKIACPYCGGPLHFAPRLLGMPYCVKCGWQLQGAKKRSRQSAYALPLVSLIFLLPSIAFALRPPSDGPKVMNVFASVVYFVGFLGLMAQGVISWADYKKISYAEPRTVTPNPDEWKQLAVREFQTMTALPVPRTVRLSRKGMLRIAIGIACLGAAVVITVLALNSTDSPSSVMERLHSVVIPIGILLLVAAWTNMNVFRQWPSHVPLLRSGNSVVGKVLQQKYQNIHIGMDFIGRYSLVSYEFNDQEGNSISSGGYDYSKSLFQDMPTLVFYDPNHPDRNVALGCSLYRLKETED